MIERFSNGGWRSAYPPYGPRHQQAGRIANIDPGFLADQFVSALRGERLQRLQLGLEPTPTETEVEDWVVQATGLFLRGCLPPEAA